MGVMKPRVRMAEFLMKLEISWGLVSLVVMSQIKRMVPMSKMAGNLKRVAMEKRRPEKKMFWKLVFLKRRR